MGTDFRRVSSVHDLSIMGQSYGIPGHQVNGMDVLEVHEATVEAVKQAKEQRLPSFLEIRTYRYKGHSMSDPGKYRTREELDEYRQQDPIILFKDGLIAAGLLTDAVYEDMDERCRRISDESADFAERSPQPEPEELYTDVLA